MWRRATTVIARNDPSFVDFNAISRSKTALETHLCHRHAVVSSIKLDRRIHRRIRKDLIRSLNPSLLRKSQTRTRRLHIRRYDALVEQWYSLPVHADHAHKHLGRARTHMQNHNRHVAANCPLRHLATACKLSHISHTNQGKQHQADGLMSL
jgi:hypothetical protein